MSSRMKRAVTGFESRFLEHKERHSIRTLEEAEEAAFRLLEDVRYGLPISRGREYLSFLEERCAEALDDAMDGFPLELGAYETCEWTVTPIGAALDIRVWDLMYLDEEDFEKMPDGLFPADFYSRHLGCSEGQYNVSAWEFSKLVGRELEDVIDFLAGIPAYCFKGSLRRLHEVRINRGAALFFRATAPRRDLWPEYITTRTQTRALYRRIPGSDREN